MGKFIIEMRMIVVSTHKLITQFQTHTNQRNEDRKLFKHLVLLRSPAADIK